MKLFKYTLLLSLFVMCNACNKVEPLKVTVYETAANGNQLKEITAYLLKQKQALL